MILASCSDYRENVTASTDTTITLKWFNTSTRITDHDQCMMCLSFRLFLFPSEPIYNSRILQTTIRIDNYVSHEKLNETDDATREKKCCSLIVIEERGINIPAEILEARPFNGPLESLAILNITK